MKSGGSRRGSGAVEGGLEADELEIETESAEWRAQLEQIGRLREQRQHINRGGTHESVIRMAPTGEWTVDSRQ